MTFANEINKFYIEINKLYSSSESKSSLHGRSSEIVISSGLSIYSLCGILFIHSNREHSTAMYSHDDENIHQSCIYFVNVQLI